MMTIDPTADPNVNYSLLSNVLSDIINKHTELKIVKFNKHKHKKSPWITNEIITSIKFRDKLHLQFKKAPPNSPQKHNLKINVATYTKIIKKYIRNAKKQYYATIFQQQINDPQKTWKTINSILNRNQSNNTNIQHLSINGQKIDEPSSISNSLNNYFVEIGQKLTSALPSTDTQYQQYLNAQSNPTFKFEPVTEETVSKTIDSLCNKTSCTSDEISTILIKALKQELSTPITIIANQIINTSTFPDALKIAKVIPIHKKDNPHDCNNYRPISILPAISKIYEKILLHQLHEHFQLNNLFYNSQYGFRKKRSTEHAALELIDRILTDMDNNRIPISIFLDLSKAFDTLNHNILLNKLQHYGIRNQSLELCRSYLTNRKQYTINSSVPSEMHLNNNRSTARFNTRSIFISYLCQ